MSKVSTVSSKSALEILDEDGNLMARLCNSCGENPEEFLTSTDICNWIDEADRNINWKCERCGMVIRRGTMKASDPYLNMYKVLAERHGL